MKLTKTLLHTTDSYIQRLWRWGIETVEDLLLFFPRDIEDTWHVLDSFAYVNITEKNTLKVKLINIITEQTRTKKKLVKFLVTDSTGLSTECVFFHTPFFKKPLKAGDDIVICWKPKYEYGKLTFVQPDIELYSEDRSTLSPIYRELQAIPTRWFREKIPLLFSYLHLIPEVLPEQIKNNKWHRARIQNIRSIHAPKSMNDYSLAVHELAYEELFEIQYKALQRKKILQESSINHVKGIPIQVDFIKNVLSTLPFVLTDQQKISLFEILKDMEKDFCMQRLLQWDVGTWKTIVAFLSILHWVTWTKCQVVYLAPTTILATQVFKKLSQFLNNYNISSGLLLWSTPQKEKKDIKSKLENGQISVIVGTHSLLQEDISYHELSYVIIDEQHRFGVAQRSKLTEYTSQISSAHSDILHIWKDTLNHTNQENSDSLSPLNWKKIHIFPHVLMMTATPIPRTLSMALYGDQDISIIREYPSNRKSIQTKIVTSSHENEVYSWIDAELDKWHQAYWISPLVEENDNIDAVSVHETARKLQMIFPKRTIWILHGKLTPLEKDTIMNDFNQGKYNILSSTSVIEVWVDNQNATVMCIENAHRFWLSQLHQFRWRVWRGDFQSYCYLLTDKTNSDRLKAIEKTQDWFELSEIDLELRWPGEVYGLRQSGVPDLKLASLVDLEKIYNIRKDIEEYLS